jgi:hypothetical protein
MSIIRRVPSLRTIVASCGRWTLTEMFAGKVRVRNGAAARLYSDVKATPKQIFENNAYGVI